MLCCEDCNRGLGRASDGIEQSIALANKPQQDSRVILLLSPKAQESKARSAILAMQWTCSVREFRASWTALWARATRVVQLDVGKEHTSALDCACCTESKSATVLM